MTRTVGLFVGRFQPIHKGHVKAIKRIMEEVGELIIVVGSAQYSHQMDNPFTAGERVTMIRLALQEAGIDMSRCCIIPVPDVHAHHLWVARVVASVPRFDVVFTNEPLTNRLFREANFTVKPIPFYRRKVCSSTEVRRRMLEGKDWEEIVPSSVVAYIKEINGVERIRDLIRTDRV